MESQWYYRYKGKRYPIEYQSQRDLTDGVNRYEHHVLTISNVQLVADSLEEIVGLIKEKIFGKK